MINRHAIFSDETLSFKTPYEPKSGDTVKLTIRTLANDVLCVYAYINGIKKRMKKIKTQGLFDYYQVSFVCPDKKVNYYFALFDEDDKVCYNRIGCVENHQSEYDFSFVPNFTVPDWAKGAVYYQIFTDRFCNGEKGNDVLDNEYFYTGGHSKRITRWEKFPDELDVRCFYGGDLQGVRQKLDYLQSLGVEVIYFNPLFVSPSNHKYDTQDYDHIDPHLAVIENDKEHALQHWEKHNGFAERYIKRVTDKTNLEKSNAYFADLVKEIHSRGMRVVIDGVFNHCGSFNKWLDREGIYLNKQGFEKGAYQSVESPYRSYFKFENETAHSPYEGWWNYITLPKLNYEESKALEEYVLKIGAKWVSEPYNVDGWRLDVAADLGHSEKYNHKFWQLFRESVRKAKPEAFIMSEHYGSPEPWLNGKEWDSVMNYDAFMEPVTWFLTGVDKHSKNADKKRFLDGGYFFDSMFINMSKFSRPSLDSALNQLSNHDHSRFLTRTNGQVGTLKQKGPQAAAEGIDKKVFCLAVLIQMTWPGSPGVYYGDEAGVVGWTDPDNRRTYPWGKEDKELIEFHKKAIGLRNRLNCFKTGSIKALDSGNGYIAYARFDRRECAVIVINRSEKPVKLSVPVWEAGVETGDKVSLEFYLNEKSFGYGEGEELPVKHGRVFVTLGAKSAAVYGYKYSDKK